MLKQCPVSVLPELGLLQRLGGLGVNDREVTVNPAKVAGVVLLREVQCGFASAHAASVVEWPWCTCLQGRWDRDASRQNVNEAPFGHQDARNHAEHLEPRIHWHSWIPAFAAGAGSRPMRGVVNPRARTHGSPARNPPSLMARPKMGRSKRDAARWDRLLLLRAPSFGSAAASCIRGGYSRNRM